MTTKLNLKQYGVIPINQNEILSYEGGRIGLWEGTLGRAALALKFTIGFIQGYNECNCD